MTYFFQLQFLRLKRWLTHIGLNPYAGLVIGLIIYVIISEYLFYSTAYANLIYTLLAFSLLIQLSNAQRNDQLKNIFLPRQYRLLRLAENVIVAFPFILYLTFKIELVAALVVLIFSTILVFYSSKIYWKKVVPTPFRKYPYEGIIGFRKNIITIAFAYFILSKGIQVDNYNLGLSGLILTTLICMSFYLKPEPIFYVWIHTKQTNRFLIRKAINALLYLSILYALPFTALVIAFPDKWTISVLIYLVSCIWMGNTILAKYSAFPNEIHLPQAILFSLSIIFPPMILVTFWLFYVQSLKKLKPILK
ncbi:MAG: hypothetical protein HRU40_19035 [Saprospiraceae bacterium]|nr:hypothetical protein [Saprospiraceae bacterium]